MEVLLALGLFVGAATVVTAGFRASATGVDQLRHQAHAVNLAVTICSEIELGIRTPHSAGPESFEAPFDDWTWEIEVASPEDIFSEHQTLSPVEVIVRHTPSAAVYRLARYFPAAPVASDEGNGLPPQLFEDPSFP